MKSCLVLLFLIGTMKLSFGCSCISYEPDFFVAIQSVPGKTYHAIMRLDSFETIYNKNGSPTDYAWFTVLDTYNPLALRTNDVIRLKSGNGADCLEFLTQYNPMDTLAVAMGKWEDDFEISICGKHSLLIEESGENSYQEVKTKMDRILTNGRYLDPFPSIELIRSVSRSQVQLINLPAGSKRLHVVNAIGRIIFNAESHDDQIEISTLNWEAGAYLIVIESESRASIRKFIVN